MGWAADQVLGDGSGLAPTRPHKAAEGQQSREPSTGDGTGDISDGETCQVGVEIAVAGENRTEYKEV